MKKRFAIVLTLILILAMTCIFVGCQKKPPVNYVVKWDMGYDGITDSEVYEEGSTLKVHETPVREGYKFLHWTIDGVKLDGDMSIKADITIKAVWEQLRLVNVVVGDKKVIYYLDNKDSYSLSDFDLKKVGADLVGFHQVKDGEVSYFDISKGIPYDTYLYPDFMSKGMTIVPIEGKDEMKIDRYTGSSRSIDIPEYYNGKKVTTIGTGAFNGKVIDKITFPTNMTTIEKAGLSGITAKSIVLPDTITYLGEAAFGGANVESVVLSIGMDTLRKDTFTACTSLKKVYIPNSITSIEKYVFGYCDDTALTIYRQQESEGVHYVLADEWRRVLETDPREVPVKLVKDISEF